MRETVTAPALAVSVTRFKLSGAASDGSFDGNHWRGAVGHALRELECLTGAPDCKGCLQRDRCVYAALYDTPLPPDAEKMRRYQEVPHPYVLCEQPTEPAAHVGDCSSHLDLTLIGAARARWPAMSRAIQQAVAQRPVGGRRLSIAAVEHLTALDSAPTAPPAAPTGGLTLQLETPLRLRRQGQPVGPAELGFADLFGSVLRRVSMLSTFHMGVSLDLDFRGLVDAARQVRANTRLQWVRQQRHSSRQQADIRMDGVFGTLAVGADVDLAPFWPILWLGQTVHAGAGTTMGLGRYRIVLP